LTSPAVSELERRAARAEGLARDTPAAEEPLRFAAGLYRVQARVAGGIAAAHALEPLTGRLEADLERLEVAATVAPILRYAAEEGPELLSSQARERQGDSPETMRTRLLVYWSGDRDASDDYLSRAVLRPYVETLRSIPAAPDRVHRRGQCPFCAGAPWVGARREGSQMEGAKRMLACSLCGGEWTFDRIVCPACLESDPTRLPHFQSDKHPHVRIEACETCRRYLKTLDLSEDARPIPEVDDLVSISMDLWATEQGYSRIEPGLAGI
jgi:formate dehydrogenase maturation protein FdhE